MALEKLQEVCDALNNKEMRVFSIHGKVNADGTFRVVFPRAQEFKTSVTHYVYMKSFTGWSAFNNVTSKNNKFKFVALTESSLTSKPNLIQSLVLPTGCYDIENYNELVQQELKKKGYDEDAVTITINENSGKSIMVIQKGFKVIFDNDTWMNVLGFTAGTYETGTHTSQKPIDITGTLKIRISCNIAKGFYLNSNESDVIYEFPNDVEYGRMISINPNPVIYNELLMKTFNEIVVTFRDDDGKPVDFSGEEFSLILVVCQA
jgi:hypothetical protein